MTVDAEVVALVRRAQAGDTLAMNDLLDHVAPYVASLCGPIALSEGSDAAQEALITVFRSLKTLRDPAALYGWVRQISVRTAIRMASRHRKSVPGDLSELPASGHAHLHSDILDVLNRLSPEHRAILLLRDRFGLTEHEAAEHLNLEVGTVKSRLHRARDYFRKAWTS
ncbi:RNA polymerase sigma factor [Natronoglycomyces albus]|uniref:Sigma-70 family RNA polymerase sigma factor n=1 Tax=Natronoglycomyces albus TaxID=2811108 RepID=A0A895XK33_9ACTN|nr:sigma factor-like helix-turn-helix DNA-binding protein [Natronoglycomyces albus]QSB03913.1 hypothetical protein JQS30_08745 [Natronoglycomyces albus]